MNDYCSSGFYKQDIVNVRINYLLWLMFEIDIKTKYPFQICYGEISTNFKIVLNLVY